MNGYFGEELLRALEEAGPFRGRTVRQADRERYEVRPPEVGGAVYTQAKSGVDMADQGEAETFQCEACGGVFERAWSDEDAREEAKLLWGDMDPAEMAQICDDCFRALGLQGEG